MSTKKIEIFTIPGRSNDLCATLSGEKYINLGYYSGNGSFFQNLQNGNFVSPAGGLGNSMGLLDVAILSSSDLSGAVYGNCCDCDGGGGEGNGNGQGGDTDPCAGIDCTNWGGGENSSPSFSKLNINGELMSDDGCCGPDSGGPAGGGLGGGSQGDVHYFTSTYRKAGKGALVFRDENLYETIGKSHWVIEWLEISKNDEISAVLSRRSSSNYFENTSINSAFYVYGSPVGVAKQLRDNPEYVMKGISMTTQNYKITGVSSGSSDPEIKYIGGMFVEFFRQIVRDSGPFGPDEANIGRNKSFVTGDLFRLVSPDLSDLSPISTNSNQNEVIVNSSLLRSALEQYVNKLTGNAEILKEMCEISPFLTVEDIQKDEALANRLSLMSSAPEDPPPASYYPQLMSAPQSVSIIKSYNQLVSSSSFLFEPLTQINEDGDEVPLVPEKTIADTWADQRSAIIRQKLVPKSFVCQPCVEQDFQPILNDCSAETGKFQAAFKIENENIPGGIQVGPVNDCRCCGNLAEDYYWNDSTFCGRNKSLCLPLAVLQNGSITGYSNYGYEHNVVPFFANKDNDMGEIIRDIKIYEFPYVVNGKLVTGKFHCLDKFYNPSNPKFYEAKEFYPLMVNINGDMTGIKFMCNNAFKSNYSGFPIQDLVYY